MNSTEDTKFKEHIREMKLQTALLQKIAALLESVSEDQYVMIAGPAIKKGIKKK